MVGFAAQILAELLRERKAGGHRVLIFTQMSRMLDVLEGFLSMHAHTYVRLDGATGVEGRQRLMDRFNSDTKIFAFILSTRSGGLGINLTGADTVVFYDSDWNPAMDAQVRRFSSVLFESKCTVRIEFVVFQSQHSFLVRPPPHILEREDVRGRTRASL